MGRHLSLSEHLPLDVLEQRYRQAKDPVARSQWQIIWLLASGQLSHQVATVTGYSAHWIRTIARRYNQQGPDAIGDQRHHNRGGKPLLNDEQQAYLLQALEGPAPGGGKWNGPKVALWMSELLGRRVANQRGWDYLRGAEYRLKVPRPAHVEADIEAQVAWKKNSHSV